MLKTKDKKELEILKELVEGNNIYKDHSKNVNYEYATECLRQCEEIEETYNNILLNKADTQSEEYKTFYISLTNYLDDLQKQIGEYEYTILPTDSEIVKYEKRVRNLQYNTYHNYKNAYLQLDTPDWSKGFNLTQIRNKLKSGIPDFNKKLQFERNSVVKSFQKVTDKFDFSDEIGEVFMSVKKLPMEGNKEFENTLVHSGFLDTKVTEKVVAEYADEYLILDLNKSMGEEIKRQQTYFEKNKDKIDLSGSANSLLVGIDGEWESEWADPMDLLEWFNDSEDQDEKAKMLKTTENLTSMQFSLGVGSYLFTFVFVTKYAVTGEEKWKSTRLKFDELCVFALSYLGFKSSRGDKLEELIQKNKNYNKKHKNDENFKRKLTSIPLTLVGHNTIVDLFKMDYHECQVKEQGKKESEEQFEERKGREEEFARYLSSVQGEVLTIGKKISYDLRVTDKNKHCKHLPLSIQVRGTMAQATGGRRLADLGDNINYPKIVIPKDAYLDMGLYYRCQPENYLSYSGTDSEICVLYLACLYGVNKQVPATLMASSAKQIQKSHKNKLLDTYDKDYLEKFAKTYSKTLLDKNGNVTDEFYKAFTRGIQNRQDGMELTESRGFQYFTKIVTEAPLTFVAGDAIEWGAKSFAGGLNCSYTYGLYKKHTVDFDLKQAYGVSIQALVDIALDEKPLHSVMDLTLDSYEQGLETVWRTKDENYNEKHLDPLKNPALFVVDGIEYPENTNRPGTCIPTDGTLINSLSFLPNTGDTSLENRQPDTNGVSVKVMTNYELYLALKMGAKVHIHSGCVYKVRKDKNGKPARSFADTMKELSEMRFDAQDEFGKGSFVEQLIKLIINSAYGKTGQAIKKSMTWDFLSNLRTQLEPSPITNPVYATLISSLPRCLLCAVSAQLVALGYTVYSITTDGFFTDAPLDVLEQCDGFGLVDFYLDCLKRIDGKADSIWAEKHSQDLTFNAETRTNAGWSTFKFAGQNVTLHFADSMYDSEGNFIMKNILAKGGWKDSYNYFSRGISPFMSLHYTAEKMLFQYANDYKGCAVLGERRQTNLRDYIEKGVQYSFYQNRIVKHNADGKRSINISTVEEVEVEYNNTILTVTNFDTLPHKQINDYSVMKSKLNHLDHALRSADEIKLLALETSNKTTARDNWTSKTNTCGSYDRTVRDRLMTAYIHNIIEMPLLKDLTREQKLEVFNEGLSEKDKPFNLYTWERKQKTYNVNKVYSKVEMQAMQEKALELQAMFYKKHYYEADWYLKFNNIVEPVYETKPDIVKGKKKTADTNKREELSPDEMFKLLKLFIMAYRNQQVYCYALNGLTAEKCVEVLNKLIPECDKKLTVNIWEDARRKVMRKNLTSDQIILMQKFIIQRIQTRTRKLRKEFK